MKLQVKQAGSSQELTVGSQKELLQLWNSGVLDRDDLVRRGDEWIRAGDLPWIRGIAVRNRADRKQLFWITLALMLLGLAGVLWVQAHSGAVARRSGALPSGSVRAVPAR